MADPLESQNCPEFLHFVNLDFHGTQLLEVGHTALSHLPEAQKIRKIYVGLDPGRGRPLGNPVTKKLVLYPLCPRYAHTPCK